MSAEKHVYSHILFKSGRREFVVTLLQWKVFLQVFMSKCSGQMYSELKINP